MDKSYARLGLYIDGAWRDAATSAPIIDPATGEEIGRVPHASVADLDDALAAARRGFDAWSAMGVDRRTPILKKAVSLLRDRAETIGAIMSLEQGKPAAEGTAEVLRSAALLEWDIEEGRRLYGRIIPGAAGMANSVVRLPIGPVAAFTPWNFPASIPARKLGALAAGCSVILKAAEETPGTACEMVRCFEEAGLPAGALNLVFGNPAQISAYLIASPVIRMVTLTGSVPVGKLVAAQAAAEMKPAVMELGGHAPVIVCADAAPETVARAAVMAKFRNAGQICTCPTRFFVHRSLYERFLSTFADGARALRVGPGSDPQSQMGPLATERRVEAVDSLIADAIGRGARLVAGGARRKGPGYYYEPTILADVPPGSRALHEEPFGPIALVLAFDELEEAIAAANAVPYALASYAFTDSARNIDLLTRTLDAGLLSVNHFGASQPEGPFGGVKDSGLGQEGGIEGLHTFTTLKYVQLKTAA
ncbi:succinate-semialdehyde dehydrogenase/glutarate-semialdehyde dehydrogenase [Paraburkholderia sp. UCT70]|uniref:NAD-dependent succinate-semialdehyde dehydrogenase n=1 Tax=Paraburkholderia sp. UCT70 TaxID=2991068 RepID=UPI003D21188B